jgi:hypothetical protein
MSSFFQKKRPMKDLLRRVAIYGMNSHCLLRWIIFFNLLILFFIYKITNSGSTGCGNSAFAGFPDPFIAEAGWQPTPGPGGPAELLGGLR